MNPRLFISLLLLSLCMPLLAASSFNDPNGHYRLPVPDGWQVTQQKNGVSLIKGDAYASLMHFQGSGSPQGLVEAIARQFTSQWKGFDGASSSACQLAGQAGFCAWYSGRNPKDIEAVLELAGTTDANSGYVLVISSPRKEFGTLKKTFERIKRGFALTGAD